jgi:hypothetical protein
MVSKEAVVFVQVSGGREPISKPSLNIIGGVQPRGLSEFMAPDIPDIDDVDNMSDIPDMPDAGAIVIVGLEVWSVLEDPAE